MSGLIAALSAGASDMSSWVLMGLPASILAAGLGQVWISVGLAIGTALSWILVAPRLRRFSIVSKDSITIPQYLTNRFNSKSKALQIICAVVFLVVYAIYSASSMKACGTLFSTVLGIDTKSAMYLGAGIIIVYTFLGGYNAVCYTDFVQGMIMLVALLMAPIFAAAILEGQGASIVATDVPENYWNFLSSGKWDRESIFTMLSGLGWGLGYFGMPHIIIRYMSIKSEKEVQKSRIIGTSWTTVILICAAAVGLIGRAFLPDITDDSLVFISMVRKIFPSFISGLFLSAILAAAMSTADSQLLASASAFVSDVYKPVFKNNASDKEMTWISRMVVIAISVAALVIASNPGSGTIMSLVENAWALFGAAFGPVIILSLYWKRFTYKGAVAGIVAGTLVDAFWFMFLKSTGLYEIIPGFIAGLLAAVIFSLLDKSPSRETEELFEKALKYRD